MSSPEQEICRVTRSKDQAIISYNNLSKWYDVLAGNFEKRSREAALRMLCPCEGERILEVGFGTGHCIVALAKAVGSSGKVYGIDISEGMMNITLSRVARAGLSDRVELRLGDATYLPFKDDFFDAVFMTFTLELFDTPEIPIVLNECHRVLSTPGRIGVAAMSKEGDANTLIKLYEWAHRKFPNYADCRPIFLRKALEDVSFSIVDQARASVWRFPVEIVLAKKS